MAHKTRTASGRAGRPQSYSQLCTLEPSAAEYVGISVWWRYSQDMDATAWRL